MYSLTDPESSLSKRQILFYPEINISVRNRIIIFINYNCYEKYLGLYMSVLF